VLRRGEIIHAAKQQSHFLETIRGVKTIKCSCARTAPGDLADVLVDQINAICAPRSCTGVQAAQRASCSASSAS
jgi:hypothetical protein